jgi:cytochrome b561
MAVTGFNRTQIGLHWAVAALLVVEFASHEGIKPAFRAVMQGQDLAVGLGANLHIYTGFALLVLVAWRLVLRLQRGTPDLPEGNPSWMEWASKLTHWAIYALLFAIPVTGIWAWYGPNHEMGDLHEMLWTVGWMLVALHTVAALYHHYVLKDGLIKRMMKAG